MANLKDLIVNGSARVLGTLYADVSGNATTATTATKLGTATVGSTITPIYLNGGTPTALGYTIAKSVPSDANFSNTTYSAGTDLSLSGTTFNHKGSGVTAGTVGTNVATSGSTLAVPYVTYNAQGHITATGTHTHTVTGFVTSSTAVTHTASTAVGNTITPVYIASDGKATALSYTIAKSVPSDANFSNTTYTAGTDLSLSGTQFLHKGSGVTAGTVGTSTATSGSTLAVPYVTYNAQGHITATGTHTHTVTGFLTGHQTIKNHGVTGATINTYATCSVAADTAAKTASITTGTFNLEAGAKVYVKFTNANTAGTPTLNINSKGAKNIFHKGAQITTGGNKALLAGICEFMYDGTQWHLVGNYIDTDNNTTYSAGTDLSLSGTTFNHKGSGVTAGTVGTNAATSGSTLAVPYITYNAQGHITATGTHTHTVTGFVTSSTAVTHTANTAVGSTIKPIYVASGGAATALSANVGNTITPMYMASGELKALSYTIAKSVPSDANFSNTTYTAGTGLTLSGTQFKHTDSITAGTVGTSTASSGSTLTVPYVTYNASGHITATGTRTHTVTGFVTSSTAVTHTNNTAVGSTLQPVYIATNGTATAISGIKVGMLVG